MAGSSFVEDSFGELALTLSCIVQILASNHNSTALNSYINDHVRSAFHFFYVMAVVMNE